MAEGFEDWQDISANPRILVSWEFRERLNEKPKKGGVKDENKKILMAI
jgi:hypothetical protein